MVDWLVVKEVVVRLGKWGQVVVFVLEDHRRGSRDWRGHVFLEVLGTGICGDRWKYLLDGWKWRRRIVACCRMALDVGIVVVVVA